MTESCRRKVGVWLEAQPNGEFSELTLNFLNLVSQQGCEIFVFSSQKIQQSYLNYIWENGAEHFVECVRGCVPEDPEDQVRSLVLNMGKNGVDDFVAINSQKGHDIVTRCAVTLDAPLIHNCVEVDLNKCTAVSRIYAGQVLAEYFMPGPVNFYTFNSDFSICDRQIFDNLPHIVEVASAEKVDGIKIVSRKSRQVNTDILSAKIVFGGGLGFESAEKFKRFSEIAEELGASVGATRSAVDAGYAPFSSQIGLTGNNISPNLYFAWGISGSFYHCAGFKGASVVVAINQDEQANIFTKSDFGVVEDIFKFLRAIREVIKNGP